MVLVIKYKGEQGEQQMENEQLELFLEISNEDQVPVKGKKVLVNDNPPPASNNHIDQSYSEIPYKVENFVRVQILIGEEEDPESYFYLKQWEKKKGLIVEVISHPTLQYRVQFGSDEGIFYHRELTIIT